MKAVVSRVFGLWVSALAAVALLALASCGGGGTVVSNLPPSPALFTNLFSTGGSFPNDMVLSPDGKLLIIANSGSNSVVAINPHTGVRVWSYDAGEGASPSFLVVLADKGWVAVVNNGFNPDNANKVDILSLQTGQLIRRIDIANGAFFQSPGKPAYLAGRLYIPNANIEAFDDFSTPENEASWGQGTVTVVDPEEGTITGTFNTQLKNPTRAYAIGGLLYVVETGSFDFTGPRVETSDAGGVEIFNPSGTSQGLFNLGQTGPGALEKVPNQSVAYLASSTKPWIFKLDLASGTTLRGPSNPIQLYPSRPDQSDAVFDLETIPPVNALVALSFNTDQIFLLNLFNDTPGVGRFAKPIEFQDAGEAGINGPVKVIYRPTGSPDTLILQTNTSRVDGLDVVRFFNP